MHEQSLVRTLLKQVETIRLAQHARAVEQVEVTIGPLSGVEPELLGSAFNTLATAASVGGAELVIRQVPLLGRCDRCDQEHPICDYRFRCPQCNHPLTVTSGDRFELTSVTLAVDPSTQPSLT